MSYILSYALKFRMKYKNVEISVFDCLFDFIILIITSDQLNHPFVCNIFTVLPKS